MDLDQLEREMAALLDLTVSGELFQVPPFDSAIAIATIERAFRRPVDEVFVAFDRVPVASASIAQVHFATLRDRQGIDPAERLVQHQD